MTALTENESLPSEQSESVLFCVRLISLTVYVRHGDGEFDKVGVVWVVWSGVAQFGRKRLSSHSACHTRLAQTWYNTKQSASTQSTESKYMPMIQLSFTVKDNLFLEILESWIIFESHVDGHKQRDSPCEALLGLDSRSQIRLHHRLRRIFRRESLLTLWTRLCAQNKVSRAKD